MLNFLYLTLLQLIVQFNLFLYVLFYNQDKGLIHNLKPIS